MYGYPYRYTLASSGLISTLCAWELLLLGLPYLWHPSWSFSSLSIAQSLRMLPFYENPQHNSLGSNYPRIWERQSLKHWNALTASVTQRSIINCVKLFISSRVVREGSNVVIVKTECQWDILYLVIFCPFNQQLLAFLFSVSLFS